MSVNDKQTWHFVIFIKPGQLGKDFFLHIKSKNEKFQFEHGKLVTGKFKCKITSSQRVEKSDNTKAKLYDR